MLALSNSYFLLFFPVLFAAWILWFAAGSLRRDDGDRRRCGLARRCRSSPSCGHARRFIRRSD